MSPFSIRAKKDGLKVHIFIIRFSYNILSRNEIITPNDLHASDGRDTEALNCKPITNL
jgi:hypothetical protein